MSYPDQRSRVTVEDLLRLKRAERPDPEFWNKFEVELRQKQLAALVQRGPWWHRLPQLFARRAYVPIGAAAVLTVTLVSVRTYLPGQFAGVPESVAPATEMAVASAGSSPGLLAHSEARIQEVAAIDPDGGTHAAESELQLSAQLPDQAHDLVPWSARRSADTPSARSIAANLARLEQTEPELVNALLATHRNESRSVQESAAPFAEFAAITAVASRRNRVLSQLTDRQFTPDPSAPEVVRERLARRLGDTELTGGWTRVGVKADRVSLKF